MSWRVAECLKVLIDEVNAKHPDRAKAADGTIGDAAHAARASDHNPNGAGVVTAWDVTTDVFTDAMAEWLRLLGAAGDRRVKYVIYKRRITSAEHKWQWVAYDGADPHTSHIHLSVSADAAQYDRKDPWRFESAPQKAPSRPSKTTKPPVEGPSTPAWFKRVLRDVHPNMHGPDVVHVQQRIGVPVHDGLFGDRTAAYVRSWQRGHGLGVDGVVGPQTARSIG